MWPINARQLDPPPSFICETRQLARDVLSTQARWRMERKLIAMLGIVALAACSKQQESVGTAATTAASTQGQALGADQVRQILLKQYPQAAPAINAMQIDTSGGKVTLRGNVNDEQTKKMLVDGAKQIPGVGNVNDELHIVGQ
jgi:hypothetical protein